MKPSIVSVSVLAIHLLVSSHFAPAQSRPSQPADYAAAEDGYWDTIQSLQSTHKTLHDYPLRDDGTKGYVAGLTVSEPSYLPMAPFLTQREATLHRSFCSFDAVIEAKLVGSESKLSSGKETIFTRYEFSVMSTVTESPKLNIPSTIYVMQLGGSVVDGRDRLKVTVSGMKPYIVGASYLLLLKHSRSGPVDVFLTPDSFKLLIKNDRIYPTTEGLWLATTGEPLSEVKRTFSDSLKQKPCY
jgi:hypothetical protein